MKVTTTISITIEGGETPTERELNIMENAIRDLQNLATPKDKDKDEEEK